MLEFLYAGIFIYMQKCIATEYSNYSNLVHSIFRALEASLADNQSNMKRLGMSYTSYEPLNPHERKREGLAPVGLKNIGNTCWFASVIQVN